VRKSANLMASPFVKGPPPCGPFLCHNARMLTLLTNNLGLQIDFGRNEPGDALQRQEGDYWKDYKLDGKPVTNPFDIESLQSGRYRLRPPDRSQLEKIKVGRGRNA